MSHPDDISGENREGIPSTPEEWLKKVRELGKNPSLDGEPAAALSEEQRLRMKSLLERREKLLQLRPRTLVLDPEHPEASPDLKQVENLYNKALVPESVLRSLDDNDATYVEGITQGGMLNRFEPTPLERREYGDGYESVRQQVISDMLKTSDRPGNYVMRGLFDPDGELRAYLSMRLPPKRPSDPALLDAYADEMDAYVQYLERVLELRDEDLVASPSDVGRNRFMEYKGSWNRQKTKSQLSCMWEFDTINVQKGWGGAGLLVVKDALEFIDAEYGTDELKSVFAYRYNGLRTEDAESGHSLVRGENKKSGDFLEGRLGFAPMAYKNNPKELVVREMSDGQCHPYRPEWTYLWCSNAHMKVQLSHWLRKWGLDS